MDRPVIVAIDGPAGAGKSSVAKRLAQQLDFSLVDTGAIYRCVALTAARAQVRFDDDAALGAIVTGLQVSFRMDGDQNRVLLGPDREDVSAAIRTPELSLAASQVSSRPVVRAGLLELQRRLGLEASRGAVLEGRDIGTVIFPDAEVKVFLSASADVRAQRRADELAEKGQKKPAEEVRAEQEQRDQSDTQRAVAPLKPAPDAVHIDSTALPLGDVVAQVEALALAALAHRAGQGR